TQFSEAVSFQDFTRNTPEQKPQEGHKDHPKHFPLPRIVQGSLPLPWSDKKRAPESVHSPGGGDCDANSEIEGGRAGPASVMIKLASAHYWRPCSPLLSLSWSPLRACFLLLSFLPLSLSWSRSRSWACSLLLSFLALSLSWSRPSLCACSLLLSFLPLS